VPGLRLLHGVHGQEPDRIHRLLHQLGLRRLGSCAERGGQPRAWPGRGSQR
jgi:ribosomal protein L30/L7E